MTRTARSLHPRAMVRDRSESKSGHDKHIRKDGGGPHGWGRLTDEKDLESAAMEDEQLEFNEENNVQCEYLINSNTHLIMMGTSQLVKLKNQE